MNRTSIELAARLYGEIDKIDDYLSRLSHSSANPQAKRRLTLHIEIEDPIGNPSLVENGRFTLDESRRFHGDGAWAANPWVAAITFTVHKGNIDYMN